MNMQLTYLMRRYCKNRLNQDIGQAAIGNQLLAGLDMNNFGWSDDDIIEIINDAAGDNLAGFRGIEQDEQLHRGDESEAPAEGESESAEA